MSRCFPFPPQGYKKKSGQDNVELFKEEKHREKKHKKDKQNKESKEKSEKDKSDKKHREKKEKRKKYKDKKEKHRDKKKGKDRDKDKEKSNISVEKNVSKGNNGEKLHEKEEFHKDKSSISDEKRPALQFHGHKEVDPTQSSLQVMVTDDFKFVLELDRRIREEQNGAGSQLDERSTGTNWKKDEGRDGYVGRDIGIMEEGKHQNKNKRVADRKMGPQRIGDEASSHGNAMVQNIVGIAQKKVGGLSQPMEKNAGKKKVEGVPHPMEKNAERQIDREEKEKSKDREGDDKRMDKRKDKDRASKKHGKDQDRNKEKKKEKSEHKKAAQDKSKDTMKNNLIGVPNDESLHLPLDYHTSSVTEGNCKKRKHIETNGFIHSNEVQPTKMPRLPSLFKDNERKLEACQTPGLSASNVHGITNKELRVNGFREALPSSAPTMMPLSSVKSADPMAEAPHKLPHPDSKYLNQILSVSKVEEWSDFDDQEWLFSCRSPPMKPEAGSIGLGEELQVWDRALQIESADICALPYVIPY